MFFNPEKDIEYLTDSSINFMCLPSLSFMQKSPAKWPGFPVGLSGQTDMKSRLRRHTRKEHMKVSAGTQFEDCKVTPGMKVTEGETSTQRDMTEGVAEAAGRIR